MKANKLMREELMVGDWVMYNPNVFIEDEYETTKKWYPTRISNGVDIDLAIEDCYTPIPLTAEILEKNGFAVEEREGDPSFPYYAFIIDNNEYRIEITWYDSHDVYSPYTGEYLHGASEVWCMNILGKCGNYDCSKDMLYVHEFQHALRLCGIEKQIIL